MKWNILFDTQISASHKFYYSQPQWGYVAKGRHNNNHPSYFVMSSVETFHKSPVSVTLP